MMSDIRQPSLDPLGGKTGQTSDVSFLREIHCVVNGVKVDAAVDARETLAEFLREGRGLTSVKIGCGVGECGACSVLADGEEIDTCITLAIWADGKNILTTEGLLASDGSLSELQQAFVDEGAIQCGYCTPGFLMSAKALLNEVEKTGRDYTDDEIRRALSGHHCRCTGYENILRAVRKALAGIKTSDVKHYTSSAKEEKFK
jgi:carbon-monoxide dehydrogenase small subunit